MHLIFEQQLVIDEKEVHRSLSANHSKHNSTLLSFIYLNLKSDLF